MLTDPFFKNFFLQQLQPYTFHVIHSYKIGELPLEIDLLFILRQSGKEIGPVFGPYSQYAKKYNIVEFKGRTDRFPKRTIAKVRGYFNFYTADENLPLTIDTDAIGWIVSAPTPKWLKTEQSIKKLAEDCPGLYQCQSANNIPVNIILLTELPIKEPFYSFLLFSKGKQLKQFIKDIFDQNNNLFKGLNYIINYDVVKVMAEAEEISLADIGSNVRAAIHSLGLKQVLEQIGYNEVIQSIGMKAIIEEIGLRTVIEEIGLRAVISEIGLAELLQVLTEQEKNQLRQFLQK
jgi:hypothetical protein